MDGTTVSSKDEETLKPLESYALSISAKTSKSVARRRHLVLPPCSIKRGAPTRFDMLGRRRLEERGTQHYTTTSALLRPSRGRSLSPAPAEVNGSSVLRIPQGVASRWLLASGCSVCLAQRANGRFRDEGFPKTVDADRLCQSLGSDRHVRVLDPCLAEA